MLRELLAVALGVGGGAWAPGPGPPRQVAAEIAGHVASGYRSDGRQLVSVVAGTPHVLEGGRSFRVRLVALQKQTSAAPRAIYDAAHQQDFRLCGGGPHCSIAFGKPTVARFRLVEREALELALDTFRFSPSIESVVVYLPAPPGRVAGPVFYLRRGDARDVGDARTLAPAAADKAVLPHLYDYAASGLPEGGVALILSPYG